MATIFDRKKSRPQVSNIFGQELRSVPYDNVPPFPGGRRVVAADTSASVTNPTLTTNDADLSMQRTKVEIERAYDTSSASTPRASLVTIDSSTFSISTDTTMNEQPNPLLSFAVLESRHSRHSSGRRSPFIRDSSRTPSPILPTPPPFPPSASAELPFIPSSDPPLDNISYPPQNESHSSYRDRAIDDFNFPKPDDDKIEPMFQNNVTTRNLTSVQPLRIQKKRSMVESNERLRRRDEETKEEQAKKVSEQSRTGMIGERSPEWYLMKFMERSITPKDASGLFVSLRSNEFGWFQQFIAMQGTRVLTQFISFISRKGKQRTETEHQLEYETLRCVKQILNSSPATQYALTHDPFASQIASSLNSPRLASRKLVVEILAFLANSMPESLNLVTRALLTVSITNNVGNSPYAYWFASFESSLSGRGKMGSLVGASEEVRKNAATESNINEYALSNLLLINGILENSDDLDLRIHHHSQMAAASLHRVVDLCRSFNFEPLNTQLDKLQETIELDEKELRERIDQEILRDMTNMEDVYAALKSQTQNTKAYDHLLSILQHLLLIREDGPGVMQYYQLLDSLVTDVVMDHKLAGAEQRLGKSVESIISQFNDADQYRVLEADASKMRADLRRLQLEKETLESEVMDGGDGLVGILKGKIASLEEKLQISRETTARLQTQMETQKSDYEEQITRLEAQIMELFRMLKEPDAYGVGKILDHSKSMDRKTLVATLEKRMQRSKSIDILEGRDRNSLRRVKEHEGQDDDEDL